MKAREVAAPEERAAANGVVHERNKGRVVGVDRVVRREPADVGVGVEVGQPAELPILVERRQGGGIDPIALLQADDGEASLGQPPGGGRAGGTSADDQDV